MDIDFKKTSTGFGYIGETSLIFVNQAVEISIIIDTEDGKNVTEKQLDVVENFLNNWNSIETDIITAIYQYYIKNKTLFDQWLPDNVRIESIEDIVSNMGMDGLLIPIQSQNKNGILYLLFSCSWDIENGIGVQLYNTDIQRVDDRSIAF